MLATVLLCGYLLLQNVSTQQKILSALTEGLSQKIHSKVTAGTVEWHFPNSFVLNKLYVEDQQKDTLAYIDRAKITVNIIPLFQNKISLRTVQLTDMRAHIYQIGSTGRYNYQFVVDAFKKKDKDTTQVTWSAEVETIGFKNCYISFHKVPYNEKPGHFNPAYLDISALNGNVFIRRFSKDSLNIKLHRISCREASGVVLSNLSTSILSNKQKLRLQHFAVSLPNSNIAFKQAEMYYRDIKSKNYFHDFRVLLDLKPSEVKLSDLSPFVPAFAKMPQTVYLSGSFSGTVDNLLARNLYVSYGKTFMLDGDFYLRGLPDFRQLYADAEIRDLSASAADARYLCNAFAHNPVKLPTMIDTLGTVTYQGHLKGSVLAFTSKGLLSVNQGRVQMDVYVKNPASNFSQFNILGSVATHNFRLGDLLGRKSGVGNTSFQLRVNANRTASKQLSLSAVGQVDTFTYKKYPYHNISLNGKFGQEGFYGQLNMRDENASLNFKGGISFLSSRPKFKFVATVQRINLGKLNLFKNVDPASSLAFEIETDFSGRRFDDLDGSFSINNVMYHRSSGKDLVVNNISMTVNPASGGRRTATLSSDYVNGNITGDYLLTSLWDNTKDILRKYVPSIIPQGHAQKKGNNFSFALKVDNTEPLNDVFKLPVTIVDETNVTGFFNDITNKFRVRLESPLIRIGSSNMEDVIMLCENPGAEAKLMVRMTHLPKNQRRNPYYLSFNASARQDSINSHFNFSNSNDVTYSGDLNLLSVLKGLDKRGLTADFFVKPTKFIINDTTWNMHQSVVRLTPERLVVSDFLFDHGDQMLKIDGVSSRVGGDSIGVYLRDLQLSYISNIVNAGKFSFAGLGNGDVYVYNIFSKPYFRSNLQIDSTALNGYPIGDLQVASMLDNRDNSILFGGNLVSNLSKVSSRIYGGIYLSRDSMCIDGDLHDIDLRFLRAYIGSVMENSTGIATGRARAFGKFGNIGLQGDVFVKDFNFGIGFLNTQYSLTDTVHMTPTSFSLRNCPIKDQNGHIATVNGAVTHHGFKDFNFKVLLDCDNFMALNTTEEDNSTFFGQAFADGKVNIFGNPNAVNFRMKVKTREGTKVTIPIGGSSSVSDADYITFVESTDHQTAMEKRRARREKIKRIQDEKTMHTKINLDMQLEATPDAQVQLIMDQRQGDVIRAQGNGALRLTYDSQTSDFGMYGNYEITKGDYRFTIQSIISRKFNILEGSTLHWTGSPYSADLDVKADYSLNASLVGILDDPNINMTTANVDCLLFITGTIQKPVIKFGIDLPNADDEVKRKLSSVINTDELVSRNVASLLALGHFYTMDKKNTSSGTGNSELSSVGFSTLSSEVGSMLSRIDNNVDVGLNYNPGSDQQATASEFEMSLSTQFLNDRLQLNGNFGYRDNNSTQASSNVSSGIMDFDIEYKLTPSGKFRVKAFNRSNNSYFKQTSAQTQGVGLIYREDFDTYGEWLNHYWHPIQSVFTSTDSKKKAKKDSTAKK